ncbi:MAG: DUF4912 domain-containing protein [Deltaproteobacteria bacterium]|nr:DUF4912 domain-containing protein [Deltaproteobacteria bacterium]
MNASLQTLSREELRQLAQQHGLEVSATSRKAELVAILDKVMSSSMSKDTAVKKSRAVKAKSGATSALKTNKTKAPLKNIETVETVEKNQEKTNTTKELTLDKQQVQPHAIPWGYGETDIVALPRDPHWLYIYWEATDDSIAAARERLNEGGSQAKFVLRVYDTTYRLFDGTNANNYFDIEVDRSWRNYFLKIDRPRAVFHIEIGMKSNEGYFAAMARSGAAEMPAGSVCADGRVEWMTVKPAQKPPLSPTYHHRFTPRSYPTPSPSSYGESHHQNGTYQYVENDSSNYGTVNTGLRSHTVWWQGEGAKTFQFLFGGETQRSEWFEQNIGGRFMRWVTWYGTNQKVSWHSGPIKIPAHHLGPVEIWYDAQQGSIKGKVLGNEQISLGPWHVLIQGINSWGERRVLDAWMIHMSWGGYGAYERVKSATLYQRIFGAYQKRSIFAGASEGYMQEEVGGSHELFVGASERLWLGGSELLLGGASETMTLGASEVFALGSSEINWGGASLFSAMGASENLYGGASEMFGSSENLLGGASGFGFAGGSESAFVGASEQIAKNKDQTTVGAAVGEGWQGFAIAPMAEKPSTINKILALRTKSIVGHEKGAKAPVAGAVTNSQKVKNNTNKSINATAKGQTVATNKSTKAIAKANSSMRAKAAATDKTSNKVKTTTQAAVNSLSAKSKNANSTKSPTIKTTATFQKKVATKRLADTNKVNAIPKTSRAKSSSATSATTAKPARRPKKKTKLPRP